MRNRIRNIVTEAMRPGPGAKRHRINGVVVDVVPMGRQYLIQATNPYVRNRTMHLLSQKRPTLQNVKALAQSLTNNFDDPQDRQILENLVTAKVAAYGPGQPVQVIKGGFVGAAGVRNGVRQMWKDEDGHILNDDGNTLTIQLSSTGRIVVPKASFDDYFRRVSSEELLFGPGQAR